MQALGSKETVIALFNKYQTKQYLHFKRNPNGDIRSLPKFNASCGAIAPPNVARVKSASLRGIVKLMC
jgi:hypothetical protein